MKRFFLTLLICLIGMSTLNAKVKPFGKGTLYLNFNLSQSASFHSFSNEISLVGTGDDPIIGETYQLFESFNESLPFIRQINIEFSLEYGLSSSLGLEFQLRSQSGNNSQSHLHRFTDRTPSIPVLYEYTWFIDGYLNQMVFSVGTNYHMNFIKINRLDIYTGLQIGVETQTDIALDNKAPDSLPSDWPVKVIDSIKNAPIVNYRWSRTQIYSDITLGARYFILDWIALNTRCGLKVSFANWPTKFYYSAGLTFKL